MLYKKTVVLGLATAASVGLAACGAGEDANAQNKVNVEQNTIRVAYSLGTQANFYHALGEELFAEHNVEVDATEFASGPDLITALVSGSADVGVFGGPAIITANDS